MIDFLDQFGWMNSLLGVVSLIAAGLGLFMGLQNGSTARGEFVLAFSVAAVFYGWLWLSFGVVIYGLAHVCRQLHQLTSAAKPESSVSARIKPAPK